MINIRVLHFHFLTFLLNFFQDFLLNQPLGVPPPPFSKQRIDSISLTTWTLRMASPWAVCGSHLPATYSEGSRNFCPRTRMSLTSKRTLLHVGTPQLRAGYNFPVSIAMALKTVTSTFHMSHSDGLSPYVWTKLYPKVSILVWHDTTSVGDCWPMTQDSVVVSTS
jgi:hypothetical protein